MKTNIYNGLRIEVEPILNNEKEKHTGYKRRDVEKTIIGAKKYVRYMEGAECYSIELTKLQALASEAGAVNKSDKIVHKQNAVLLT